MADRPVGLAVDAATASLSDDDRVLADAIVACGGVAEAVQWGSGRVDVSCLVIRSPWDYVRQPGRFLDWLDELDDERVTVINPTAMLRWNMHKRYLLDLSARGVPIVPTVVVERGASTGLETVLSCEGWRDAVIKPAIGATARLTIRTHGPDRAVTSRHFDVAARHFDTVVRVEDVLVQPFVPAIMADGELSIVAIGGEPTHVVHKRPKDGEWRVQSDFGGSVERLPMTAECADIATAALGAVDGDPWYARVDVVRIDGRLHVMELELIEPDLFFLLAPEAADRLADLIVCAL